MDPHGTKFQPRGEGGLSGPGGRRAVGGHVGEAAGEQAIMKLQTSHWASIVARAGSSQWCLLHLFKYDTHHSMLRSTLNITPPEQHACPLVYSSACKLLSA